MTIHRFTREYSGPVDPPSGGGDDGRMDARLTALETKWETVVPTLATKGDVQTGFADIRSDLHKVDGALKTWMLATVLSLFLGFGGLFFAMSNALKPAPAAAPVAAQQPAPIIINVPTPAAPVATPTAKKP